MRPPFFLAALCCLAGCAFTPDYAIEVEQQPQAILDAYLIAHGMAESYVVSPGADPDVVIELARLDMQAVAAAEALLRAPRQSTNQDATARAVSALTDFAARQSLVTR